MKEDVRQCGICQRRVCDHSGDACGGCGEPVEHHSPAEATECWEGRARMAVARRDAGLDLSARDVEALRRCPKPTFLSIDGYR